MEAMATEVIECLQHARFGGRFLHTGRGVKTHQFLFDDEENLGTFLSLTEERKQSYRGRYKPVQNTTFIALQNIWGVSDSFECSYCDDYHILQDEVCFIIIIIIYIEHTTNTRCSTN